MNCDPEILIAYLYDELPESDRREVESLIESDQEVRAELAELQKTLGILSKVQDREVDPPRFSFSPHNEVVVGMAKNTFYAKYLAVAASIVIVLLAGYLTEFSASVKDGDFTIAFGQDRAQNMDPQVIQAMISNSMAENQQGWLSELERRDDELKLQLQAQMTKASQQQVVAWTEDKLEKQKIEYLSILRQMMENYELSQKSYTDDVLADFALYLDIQRESDLNVIQTRLDALIQGNGFDQFQTNRVFSDLGKENEPNHY